MNAPYNYIGYYSWNSFLFSSM